MIKSEDGGKEKGFFEASMLFATYKEKLPMMQQDIPAGKPATNVGDGERVLSAITGSLLLYFVTFKINAI